MDHVVGSASQSPVAPSNCIEIQTDTHPIPYHKDEKYVWNKWDLRRKAIKLADMQQSRTHSTQTTMTYHRSSFGIQYGTSSNAAQTNKQVETQTQALPWKNFEMKPKEMENLFDIRRVSFVTNDWPSKYAFNLKWIWLTMHYLRQINISSSSLSWSMFLTLFTVARVGSKLLHHFNKDESSDTWLVTLECAEICSLVLFLVMAVLMDGVMCCLALIENVSAHYIHHISWFTITFCCIFFTKFKRINLQNSAHFNDRWDCRHSPQATTMSSNHGCRFWIDYSLVDGRCSGCHLVFLWIHFTCPFSPSISYWAPVYIR